MKILIVEDEEIQIQILDKIVSRFRKTETIRARDAFDAYAALRSIPDIDLILIDHEMPFVNGLTFLSKVKSIKQFADIKVIAISGANNQKEYESQGVDGYVNKPVSIDKLTGVISQVTDTEVIS